ncbi:PilT/PilU family type 4a pilus ATPase [Priestia filamentosa]|uniref:type IV pilus twitching motility protein PilT n=1 Tax=Priestia filamentosa TaxID=1402861 RepID=UPI003979C0A7
MNDLERILQTMVDKGASDLHLNHNTRISYRIDGKIVQDGPIIRGDQVYALALFAISAEQQRIYYEKKSIDFSYALGKIRFRGSLIYQKGQPSCVFRRINTEVIPIDELNLPPVIKEKALLSWGMILVTGPTGSGKSTTLASILDYINEQRFGHIATIEEPVEFIHKNKNCIVTQREVGRDSSSFAESMKTVLRQDPDVILVGEMRDLETVSAAVTNAETGHLVLGTLHTNTAPQAIQRIVDMYPPEQARIVRAQLANNLKMVINQRLVPLESGGRKALYEVMVLNEEMKDIIRSGKDELLYEAMEKAPEIGNIIMNFE